MKAIQEYSETTSAYELFTFLYWKIIDGEIRSFADLAAFTEGIPDSKKKGFALRNGFLLIRRLYWGFFRDLTGEHYSRLWSRLTIQDRVYDFGHDLKRNMTITNVYIAFIDIHGYTAFCQKAGRNTSMLRLLDESIEKDIRELCRENSVLSGRIRGDEIILVGATALDVMHSVVGISEYFSRRRDVTRTSGGNGRSGNSIILPEMKISAGIAGGRKYTPLIITEGGDLSGTVVNTAARLQSMANKLSRDSTRILTSHYVYIRFREEAARAKDPLLTEERIRFMKAGTISMKGVRLPLVEVLADPDEHYRHTYQEDLHCLQRSIRKGLWSKQVFQDLLDLLDRVVRALTSSAANGTNGSTLIRPDAAGKLYDLMKRASFELFDEKDFSAAVGHLGEVVAMLEEVPKFDPIILKYARIILEKYRLILKEYQTLLNTLYESQESKMFNLQEITTYRKLLSQTVLFREYRSRLFGRIDAEKRKVIWQQGIQTVKDELEVKLYFGKH